jgi:hypothetical protein
MVATSVLIGIGLMEGLTRLFFPAFDTSGQVEFDYFVGGLALGRPESATRQMKNTGDFDVAVRINRYGLRDDADIAQAKEDDVVVVGDSFVWGWGVAAEQRFSNLLRAKLPVRIFNLATPTDLDGYDMLLDYARSLGAHQKRIVLAVTMENDLRLYGTEPYAPEQTVMASAMTATRYWLAQHSAAYGLVTTAIHQTPWLQAIAVSMGLIVPNFDGMSQNSYSPEVIEASAAKIAEIAGRYQTLVMLIPSRALWIGANRAVEDKVHRALVAALVRRGLEILDLRPLFEAGGAPLAYHFANDPHWNAEGHRLAAEAIARRLAADGGETRP